MSLFPPAPKTTLGGITAKILSNSCLDVILQPIALDLGPQTHSVNLMAQNPSTTFENPKAKTTYEPLGCITKTPIIVPPSPLNRRRGNNLWAPGLHNQNTHHCFPQPLKQTSGEQLMIPWPARPKHQSESSTCALKIIFGVDAGIIFENFKFWKV